MRPLLNLNGPYIRLTFVRRQLDNQLLFGKIKWIHRGFEMDPPCLLFQNFLKYEAIYDKP